MTALGSALAVVALLSGCSCGLDDDSGRSGRWCDTCAGVVGASADVVRLSTGPSEEPLCPVEAITVHNNLGELDEQLAQKLGDQLKGFDGATRQLVCYTIEKCVGNTWRVWEIAWHTEQLDTLVLSFQPPCQAHCGSSDTYCGAGFHLSVWMTPIAPVVACGERHLCDEPGPGPEI